MGVRTVREHQEMWRSEGEVMLDKVTGKEQGIVFDLERGYRDGGRHVAWATQCHSRGSENGREK